MHLSFKLGVLTLINSVIVIQNFHYLVAVNFVVLFKSDCVLLCYSLGDHFVGAIGIAVLVFFLVSALLELVVVAVAVDYVSIVHFHGAMLRAGIIAD